MSDLRVPSLFDDLARMRKDVDDLLRRAPQFTSPDPPLGCCTRYCCLDDTGYTVTTGSIQSTCEFAPDPIGGTGLRLSYSGWARVRAGGAGAFAMVWWAEVDGTKYDGAPRWDQAAIASLDTITIPLGGTIDVATPDPTLTIRMQNLAAVTIGIVQVYVELEVLPIEGDSSCGQPHVGTGPL